jgi:xylulokinase
MSFVLLDVGGTFIKSRLSDAKTEFKIDFPKFIKSDSKYIKEVDPFELMKAINLILKRFIGLKNKIDGILISGQMHGWVITDKEFNPIHNIISWQDMRSLENGEYQSFISGLSNADIFRCGNEIKPGSPIVGLSSILKRESYKEFKILSLLSWIAAQLVENYSYKIHKTDAAAFSCFDLILNDWDRNMLNLARIKLESLPTVENKINVIGLSKSDKIPVFTPVGDFQASLLGAKLENGEISLNIATGGQVSYLGEGMAPENLQTRPYFNELFLHTKTHLPAGRHANYILSKFRNGEIQKNWDYLNSIDFKEAQNHINGINFNLDVEKIYQNNELTLFESEARLIEYFVIILKKYTDILDLLPMELKFNVVGSGGLITNSSFVRNCLEYLGKFRFKRIIIGEDASLNGLEQLSKMVNR